VRSGRAAPPALAALAHREGGRVAWGGPRWPGRPGSDGTARAGLSGRPRPSGAPVRTGNGAPLASWPCWPDTGWPCAGAGDPRGW